MPITAWVPHWETGLQGFMDEFERSFEDFFGRQTAPARGQRWLPPVDVYETETEVVVVIDLPAVALKELRVSITGEVLTIEGERPKQEPAEVGEYFRSERPLGPFQRMIDLPAEVLADSAKASYQDGVLKIVIPKSRRVVQKEVKVRVTGE